MVKELHNTASIFDTALVVIGWLAFLLGIWARAYFPVYALCLSAVARVLP